MAIHWTRKELSSKWRRKPHCWVTRDQRVSLTQHSVTDNKNKSLENAAKCYHQTAEQLPGPRFNIKTVSPSLHMLKIRRSRDSKLTIVGSDNGLSPGRRQTIIWTSERILSIRTFRTHFSEIVSEIHTFSFKKTHFKMSSGKWWPSCLGLNVLTWGFLYW